MTNRDMRSRGTETGGDPYPQPASRLRRALDLARRAADASPLPEGTSHTRDASPVPVRAAPAPAPRPERLRAIGSALETKGQDLPRRRSSGRGLDALIPPEPVGPRSVEEAWVGSTQGWVRSDAGALTWRPIVTTTHVLEHWEVETYLGLVSGEVLVDSGTADARVLGAARRDAADAMVADAVGRGAHGVIGVTHEIDPFGPGYLLTATGTAVTLRHRG